jgi:hypothetical protein
MMDRAPKFEHPATCLVSGVSGSGKTKFVQKCLKHLDHVFRPVPERLVVFYGAWQPAYDSINSETGRRVEFYEGIRGDVTFDPAEKSLLIIDDLQLEARGEIAKYFTKFSHHKNVSVFYLVQNLFHKSPEHRAVSLNSNYMCLFSNPRDRSQIMHLAKQVYPSCPRALQQAFEDATSIPHGYLILDLKAETPDKLRMRSNIFPDETLAVYQTKKSACA